MKTFRQLYQELREARFEEIKVGDKVGSKMHRNDKATYHHGIVVQVRSHPIYGHEVLFKTGEDKYGDVVHAAPIKHIVKESEPSTFVSSSGGKTQSIRHHDENELTRFLQSDEGKGHMFIGKDDRGKPHTAKVYHESTEIPLHPVGSMVKVNRPSHWAHGKEATVLGHSSFGFHGLQVQGEQPFTLSGKHLKPIK
jgi:hypothetical protein